MRPVSRKRAELVRRFRAERRAYLQEFPQCMLAWEALGSARDIVMGSRRRER